MSQDDRDKVFFSWQSDVSETVTKTVIRKAIQTAIKQVNTEIKLQSAKRKQSELKYDADTIGATGNPAVFDKTCEKIEAAAAFVADVTYVATVEKGKTIKGIPNANVMIEYGYAVKSLTRDKTILIMNTAFGAPDEITLPFDLNHVRWPPVKTLTY